MIAGNIEIKKLKEIEFALVVRLSFCISLMIKLIVSYNETSEKPGGMYDLDQSNRLLTILRLLKMFFRLCFLFIKTMVLVFQAYIPDIVFFFLNPFQQKTI